MPWPAPGQSRWRGVGFATPDAETAVPLDASTMLPIDAPPGPVNIEIKGSGWASTITNALID